MIRKEPHGSPGHSHHAGTLQGDQVNPVDGGDSLDGGLSLGDLLHPDQGALFLRGKGILNVYPYPFFQYRMNGWGIKHLGPEM